MTRTNLGSGSYSLAGPIIGALILTPLPELLRDYLMWQQVMYGVILMLFMRFLPDGVVSIVHVVREQARTWREKPRAEKDAPALTPRPAETRP